MSGVGHVTHDHIMPYKFANIWDWNLKMCLGIPFMVYFVVLIPENLIQNRSSTVLKWTCKFCKVGHVTHDGHALKHKQLDSINVYFIKAQKLKFLPNGCSRGTTRYSGN